MRTEYSNRRRAGHALLKGVSDEDQRDRLRRHPGAPQKRTQQISNIVGRTHIARAGRKRSHPHFFIRYTVGADDGQFWTILMERSYVSQLPVLNVEADSS